MSDAQDNQWAVLLQQLTPQAEAVVLLKEIKALLEKHFDGDDDRPPRVAIVDLVKNIEPTKTPFMQSIAKGGKGKHQR